MVSCCSTNDCGICNTFVIKKRLGRGSFSSVYKITDENDHNYALKLVKRNKRRSVNAYREFVLADFEHPNIIKLYECIENDTYIGLVIDYAPNGTLDDIIFQNSRPNVETIINNYFLPICYAVKTLHKYNIIHRDIKPENILIKGDTPLLADFGFAQDLNKDPIINDTRGTVQFVPPEVLIPKKIKLNNGEKTYKIGLPSDVWAIGVTLYIILFKKFPFDRKKKEECESDEWIKDCIITYNFKLRGSKFDNVYDKIFYEQEKRPKIKKVISMLEKIISNN